MGESRLKIQAFFKEFLFLGSYVAEGKVTWARVERVDEKSLSDSPGFGGFDGVIHQETKRIYLLNQEGKEITRVRSGIWDFIGKGKRENVFQALQRVGERATDVSFILRIFLYRHDPEDPGQLGVCLYKKPKDVDLKTWIEEKVQAHLAVLS